MNFNSILFPSPELDLNMLEEYKNELIYIPKSKDNQYIPCVLLQAIKKKLNKNYCIFFHGNAEDVFVAREMADYIRLNLCMNVIIVEYPGYSIYKDTAGCDQILLDCLTVYDYFNLHLKVEEDNMYVLGRSIGTSPALFLSSKRKPAALILISPFTSIRSAAQDMLGNIFKFFVSERFTNIEYIKEVSCPIMFLHGQKDTLIPFDHTLKLKEVCKCPYEVILPVDMTHNQFDYENDLINNISEFLTRHTNYNKNDYTDSKLPITLFNMPHSIRENINLNDNIMIVDISHDNAINSEGLI